MARPTTHVRIPVDLKNDVAEIAGQDRRTLQESLVILLEEAIANRRKSAA